MNLCNVPMRPVGLEKKIKMWLVRLNFCIVKKTSNNILMIQLLVVMLIQMIWITRYLVQSKNLIWVIWLSLTNIAHNKFDFNHSIGRMELVLHTLLLLIQLSIGRMESVLRTLLLLIQLSFADNNMLINALHIGLKINNQCIIGQQLKHHHILRRMRCIIYQQLEYLHSHWLLVIQQSR